MKKILNLIKSLRDKADHGDAVLVTTIISIPLLCVCFAFATGISMATWQETSYNSAAQAAATASLQKVKSDGYLGEQTMQGFVSEYLSQTGRAPSLKLKDDSNAVGQGSGAGETGVFQSDSCKTAKVNGVERKLPFIEVELDINRTLDESTIATYPYWSEGGSALKNPDNGFGKIIPGQQYRVINAKVWEASKNVTWFGVSAETPQDMTCQGYSVNVSAILFGNNEDLKSGQQCFQPDVVPVSPTQLRQVNVAKTAMYTSPLETCTALADTLDLNQPVEVLGTYRTWSYVQTIGDGKKGWVPSERLSELSVWTIDYKLNGGTPDAQLPSTYSWKDSRETITIPNASKTDYRFTGWQQVDCATRTPKEGVEPVVPTKIVFGSYNNICFDAVFTLAQANISWDPNGGPGAVTKAQYPYGQSVNVPDNPVREGYVSNGWFTSPTEPVGKITTAQITVGASDVVYYQQYSLSANTITVVPNGGVGGSSDPSTYTMSTSSQTATITPPTRPGYSLSWIMLFELNTPNPTMNGNTLTIPAGYHKDIQVTARWSAFPSTITVDANGGRGGSASPSNYTVDDASRDVALTVPTRGGYTFNGWTVTKNTSGGSAFVTGNTLKIPAGAYGPITVQANWTAERNTITRNPNGGSTNLGTGWYTISSSITTFNLGTPTRSGYKFMGWSISQNSTNGSVGLGKSTLSGTNDTVLNIPAGSYGDIIVTAKWCPNTGSCSVFG